MKLSAKLRSKRSSLIGLLAAGLISTCLPIAVSGNTAAADPLPYQDISLPFSVRAADLVSRMTQQEKADQFFTGMFVAGANYQAPAIPRLDVHSYNYWNEALHGVARRDNTTEFPTGLGIASTWDRDLVYSMTGAISDEARAKTNDCVYNPSNNISTWCQGLTYWSPTINLARDPRWGRADESYGEDPYFAGELAGQFAQGLQGGRNTSLPDSVGGSSAAYLKAVSTPKHFLANNSEINRHNGTSNLTDRSLHEYYTYQFGKAAGTEYGAKSFMTSYNAVNVNPDYTTKWGRPEIDNRIDEGTPVPANKYVVETLMRRMYGFDGFVTSDCNAIQDTWEEYPAGHSWAPPEIGRQINEAEGDAYSLKAGTDMDCTSAFVAPIGTYRKALFVSEAQGLATEADWDVALTRAFTIRMQLGEFDDASQVPYRDSAYTENNPTRGTTAPQHLALAHQMSLEAPVLLKNKDNVLPLTHTPGRKTVVLGYYSTHVIHGGYSPATTSVPSTTAAEEIKNVVGATDFIGNDQAISGAVGKKPGPQVSFFGGTGPNFVQTDGTNPARVDAVRLSNLTGWRVDYDFNGGETFKDDGSLVGSFTAANFAIPADATKITLGLTGSDIVDRDASCNLANTGDTCPTFGHFDVNINGEIHSYPVNVRLTIGSNSNATVAYIPLEIPLADFTGYTPGNAVNVDFSFAVGSGATGAPGLNLSSQDEQQIRDAENVIVYVGTRETDSDEERDRADIELPRWQADLAARAVALNPKTVVWIQSVGQVDLTKFKDQAKAIVWTSYNGMYQGKAAAELLFGKRVTLEDGRTIDANPTGKLTYTYYSDVDAQLGTTDEGASMDYSLTKTEGSRCGRTYWYYQAGTPGCANPDYPFGHGLSYTTFNYGDLQLSRSSATPNDTVQVSVTVKNAGTLPGRETVQLYASSPRADGIERPFKQLKGFAKTKTLAPGATETISIELKAADLWFWNSGAQKRVYDNGTWQIQVAPSAANGAGVSAPLTITGNRKAGVDIVSAVPDGTQLNLDTPANVIHANLSVTRHDQSFYKLADVSIAYTSSNPAVASVNAKGIVSPVGVGQALITATATADGETKSTNFPVVVTSGVPEAAGYLVSFADQQIPLQQAIAGTQLHATALDKPEATYKYSIAPMDLNEIGAQVSADGVLTASGTGEVEVTVVADVAGVKKARTAVITVNADDDGVGSSSLARLISDTDSLNAADYESVSWQAFVSAKDAAKSILADQNATPAQVNAALQSLTQAMLGLTPAATAAREALAAVVALADTLPATEFTASTWKAVADAKAEATALLASSTATKAQLDAALAKLKQAFAALKTLSNDRAGNQVTDLATAKLKAAAAVWTGKAVTPKITANGKLLKVGTDYTVAGTAKNIGKATLTLTGKGLYTGTAKVSVTVVPKAVALSKVAVGKKRVNLAWPKAAAAAKVSGYQVSYKAQGSSKWLTKNVKGTAKTTLTKLTRGKAYQVRIRAYKTISKVSYYSTWSSTKTTGKVK